MTRIKICGITDVKYAVAAAEAGADFIGLVFAPSPRNVTLEKAREIAVVARQLGLETVGVFVNAPPFAVDAVTASCSLDRVQISGDENWEYCWQIEKPIVKTVRIPANWDAKALVDYLDTGSRAMGPSAVYLLDTFAGDKYGGTGKNFNWEVAREAVKRFPVIIAGGLNAENVAQVVSGLNPWGVDVSSGVETGGVKDIEKIKAFVQAVRSAQSKPDSEERC